MKPQPMAVRDDAGTRERVLGRVRGGRPGPTLLCIGALHGNEPAGVRGLERVLANLVDRNADVAGEFVALVGNPTALAAGRRFIDRDLNRAWTEDRLQLLRAGHLDGHVEDREQVDLLEHIEEVVRTARGPVYVLDLHTTSGLGGAFTTFGDTLPNRDFAARIPAPMILGLEEQVEGTLLAYLGSHGLVSVAFESGQHEEPEAVERAEAAVWVSLVGAGLLPRGRVPEAAEGWRRLRREGAGVPRALEMRYRHPVRPTDHFRMMPGFGNFQPVRAGQVVARDRNGEVRAPEAGRILMPLYQEQGEDGFFLVREFRPLWLWVSAALRRIRVDRVAHHLPGVRRHRDRPDTVVVDMRLARWFAPQLFHLLGFRMRERVGHRLVMRRRSFDDARFGMRPPTGGAEA